LAGNEGADTGCCLTGGDMGAKCTERSTLTNKNNGIMTSFYYKQIPFHFLSGGQIQNKENTQNRQTTKIYSYITQFNYLNFSDPSTFKAPRTFHAVCSPYLIVLNFWQKFKNAKKVTKFND